MEPDKIDRPTAPDQPAGPPQAPSVDKAPPTEKGGSKGPDPTRYGDWERGGRCIDF